LSITTRSSNRGLRYRILRPQGAAVVEKVSIVKQREIARKGRGPNQTRAVY